MRRYYPELRATRIPGAARPDLEQLLYRHGRRSTSTTERDARTNWHARYACTIVADSMSRTTTPSTLLEDGTNPVHAADPWNQLDERLDAHRRVAHSNWMRAVTEDDDEDGALRAWMVARRYCGLPGMEVMR